MACYISSAQNRFYVAPEVTAGHVGDIESAARIPAVSLKLRQVSNQPKRRDKTGSRTFQGMASELRRETDFRMRTYLNSWTNAPAEPPAGYLVKSALWGEAKYFEGIGVASVSGLTVMTTADHGLLAGQAVSFGGEIRFVAGVASANSVTINAPFSVVPTSLGPSMTYLAGDLPTTVSVFDYWSPATAVHRIAAGAVTDEWRLRVNGDFHEFDFRGPAFDVLDSASFTVGDGHLPAFPSEPSTDSSSSTVVPGHLGQVWLGSALTQFGTLVEAEVSLRNNVDMRSREFGSSLPRCVSAGAREVFVSFAIHERDNDATKALYQAARSRSPISVMFQLGQQAGQLCGVFIRGVVPTVPEFDDSETRLIWRFAESQAMGVANDEIFVAFA